MMSENVAETFSGWVKLELFGHKVEAGYLTERQISGAGFLQLTVPATDEHPAYTKLYSPSAVYGISPLEEETARALAGRYNEPPVTPYMLPAPRLPQVAEDAAYDDAEEDDGDDDDGGHGYLGGDGGVGV